LSLKFIDLHKDPNISISSFHLLNQKITGFSNYQGIPIIMFLRVIGLTQQPQTMIDILKILLRSKNFKILILRN